MFLLRAVSTSSLAVLIVEDIDSISTSGPFQLSITTFERAKLHYADRKPYNFELKQALSEARYDELWRRINEKNGRIR